MRSTFLAALSVVALAFAPTAASAGDWYVGGQAGYSVDGKLDFKDDPDASFDDDWMGALDVGYAYGNGWRAEIEYAHRTNDIARDVNFAPGGEVQSDALMLNGYYDFLPDSRFKPFLGLGVGAANVSPDLAFANGERVDNDDTVFAYQGMAGVGWQMNPHLTLDVRYTYFRADGGEYGQGNVTQPVEPEVYEADYEHQGVTVGLRWNFGGAAEAAPVAQPATYTPPPPPAQPATPPPAAACPTSDFTVYFAWNQSTVSAAAKDTIVKAVQQARACNLTSADVVGHTDTSGGTAYNEGLSSRRAMAVRLAMIEAGLDEYNIRTSGVGETDLAKSTGDGVREPLNRRAVVTIRFH